MISRTPVVVGGGDPLAKPDAGFSPSSQQSPSRASSHIASSFVFVESALTTPQRSFSSIGCFSKLATTLAGEDTQAMLHDVDVLHPVKKENCKLFVSNYRIVVHDASILYEVPLTCVLDLKSKSAQTRSVSLDIKCKDCRFFQLSCRAIPNPSQFLKLVNSLIFGIPGTAFTYFAQLAKSLPSPAVNIFSLRDEFHRLCAGEESSRFRVSDDNKDYVLCPTYPRELLVPMNATPEILLGSSKFRDKGRIPVLSWFAAGGGSIWRSSQPKSSLLNRSGDDEELLKLIDVKMIVDCRPMLNAYANIANGAGVESLGNYHAGIELWFASIPNIHHIRDSWEKMFILSQSNPASGWLSSLEATGWYDHLSLVLRAAATVVDNVKEGKNVLCRCSHGLDRTPQVVSLAMLCLDGHYRTVKGFATLIEKEWIAMGHRFTTRFCLGMAPSDEMSPIFFQFVEAVFQLMQQFPSFFEFTPLYLVLIFQSVLSCRFGNFLLDSEKERCDAGIMNACENVWPHLWKNPKIFNKGYEEANDILNADVRVAALRIFSDVWLSTNRTSI